MEAFGDVEARAALFLGEPKTGKTHAAIEWGRAIARKRRFPLLVVDAAAALNFATWRRIESPQKLALAWRSRESAWTPGGRDEVDAFCAVVMKVRRIVLVFDESAYWIDSSRGRGGGLERLYRTARHPDCYVALTTQYAGADVSTPILACRPRVFVFRTPQPLGRIGTQYGIAEKDAAALPDRRFIFRA